MQCALHRRIGWRTAAMVLAVSAFVGAGFTLVSVHVQQVRDRADVARQVETLLDAISGTASAACFVADQHLAQETLAGLGRSSFVQHATIGAGTQTLAQVGRRSGAPATRVQRALKSPFSEAETVCQIEVELNEPQLRQREYEVALRTAALQGLHALAVALAVLLAVSWTVTRPIGRISLELRRLEGQAGGTVTTPPGHAQDELGGLVDYTNRMIQGMAKLLASERQLRELHARDEQRLRLIIENAETGLFTLDAAGRMVSWNPACVRVLAGPARHDAHPTLQELLPAHADAVDALCQRVRERARSASIDLEVCDPQCVSRWIQLILTPADDGTMHGLVNDITERKRAEAEAQQLAVTDSLTGVLNRLGLERALKDRVAAHARNLAQGFAIAMIDLDWFKQVNDTHGHDAGDLVLRVVAARIKRDLRHTDTLARLGGDEFVIVLDGVTEESTALGILHKIRESVLQPIELENGASAQVGASIGLTVSRHAVCGTEELMRRADQAMYEVKKDGRNGVHLIAEARL